MAAFTEGDHQPHFVMQVFGSLRIGHVGIVQQRYIGRFHEEGRLTVGVRIHFACVHGRVPADAKNRPTGKMPPPATAMDMRAGGAIT